MSRRLKLKTTLWHRPSTTTKKEEGVPIFCRITAPRSKKTELDTGIRIQNGEWDKKQKQILPSNKNHKKLNEELDTLITDLEAHYTVLQKKYEKVTSLMVKNDYNHQPVDQDLTSQTKQNQSLLKSIDSLIEEFEKKVNKPSDSKEKRSKETLKQWYSTRTKLVEYLSYKHTKIKPHISRKNRRDKAQQQQYLIDGKKYDVTLTDIKPIFAEEFLNYLTEDRTIIIGSAAANKQIKNTKQVFTYAVTKGWLNINPLAYFRTADTETEVIPLEESEINLIKNATNLVPRVERIRDCYLAQIYTGFAFQDLKALTKNHIYKEPATGVYFLCKERGKTKIDEMVPILPELKRIMDKYQNDPECLAEGVLFPVPSNTCYNQYLKDLQIHCKILKKLHSHLGRHSFAHMMLNHYGFSLEIVSRMLGHKSIRTTQRYCKISLKHIAEVFAPELVIERPKLTVIREIEATYLQYGVAA